MNSNEQSQTQSAPATDPTQPLYKNILRPEQITATNFGFLGEEQIGQYQSGFRKLWEAVNANPVSSQLHQQAVRKLNEVNNKLMTSLRSYKAAQAARQGNSTQSQQGPQGPARPPSQGQPQTISQADGQQLLQLGIPRAPIKPPQDLPQDIKAAVGQEKWALPPNAAATPEAAEKYRVEATKRYGDALYVQRAARAAVMQIDNIQKKAQAEGKELPKDVPDQRRAFETQHAEATEFIKKLMAQQTANRQQNATNAQTAQVNLQQTQHSAAEAPQQPKQQPSQITGGPTPINTAVDASRQQNQTSASASAQGVQNPVANLGQMSAGSQPHLQGLPGQRPGQLPAPGMQFGQNQQQSSQPGMGNQQGSPVPLSHQEALSAASRSWGGQQQGTPQTTNQYASGRVENIDAKRKDQLPISKGFVPQPPQPVAMGASRPTMTGANNGPLGMMGQPVIQKPEPYLLQGPGDRVLDKKKLNELVRQVTGGGGKEGEGLQPDVEESVLQLADEFVENVVSTACKLAKLRGSTTLDIRDIQLVLERHYNIRIPGYATDEVRTVRKVQPSPGYLQKMNAVQSAKLMAGKQDL